MHSKRFAYARVLFAMFLCCTVVADGIRPAPAAARNDDVPADGPAPTGAVGADWSLYSWGLYYRNRAMQERKGPGREALLRKALGFFQQSAASGVSLDRVYYQISECYFSLKDYGASLDFARKSIAIDSRNRSVYNRIFGIHLKRRDYAAAAEILQEYLRMEPESVQVRFLLAEHYYNNMRNMEKAAAAYRSVIELSSRVPVEDYYRERALLSLANIAYRNGDLAGAVAMYREVLDSNRENLDAVYFLAMTYLELYDLDNAERSAQAFLEKRPDDQAINSVLGRVYYLRGDHRAITRLGRAKGRGSLSGLLAWGLYCELSGKDDAAMKLLGTVMRAAQIGRAHV